MGVTARSLSAGSSLTTLGEALWHWLRWKCGLLTDHLLLELNWDNLTVLDGINDDPLADLETVLDSLRVAEGVNFNFLTRFESISWHFYDKLILVVMVEEVELEGLFFQRWIVFASPVLVVLIISSFTSDTFSSHLLALIEPYIHISLESELWDLNIQLFHKSSHKFLNSAMNIHCGLTMEWSLLKINNDKLSTISYLVPQDVGRDADSEA